MNTLNNTNHQNNLKWGSRPVNEYNGNLTEISNIISVFKREPFKRGQVENKRFDTIINHSKDDMPIATVSKSYSLIQHSEILDFIRIAFEKLRYDIDKTTCDLYLTEYDECMWLKIQFFTDSAFLPTDGYVLIPQLHIRNSVDGTTPLNFDLSWYRLVCENGFMLLDTKSRLKKHHTKFLKPDILIEYLDQNITKIEKEKEVYEKWEKKELNPHTDLEILQNWIDTVVFNKWGFNKAERVNCIIETGQDAKIRRFNDWSNEENKKNTMVSLSLEETVPGARPAENIYDVANALSWVASHHNSLPKQYKMMLEVPEMLKKLEKHLKF